MESEPRDEVEPLLRITLDTNCVIDYINNYENDDRALAASKIIKYTRKGKIDAAVTTRVSFELCGHEDQKKVKKDLETLNKLPLITESTQFRLNHSCLRSDGVSNGGDHLVNKEGAEREKRVREALFLGGKEPDDRDVDHLIGHIISERDTFVTNDEKHFKKDKCKDKLGVKILTAVEFAASIKDLE